MSDKVGMFIAAAIIGHALATVFTGCTGNGQYAFSVGSEIARLDTRTGVVELFTTEAMLERLNRKEPSWRPLMVD